MKKNKVIQVVLGFILSLVAIYLGLLFYDKKPLFGIDWFFGIIVGIILTRGRFSFTANIHKPIYQKKYDMTKPFILMTTIATIGVTYIQYQHYKVAIATNTEFYTGTTPVSIMFVVGAFLFGYGMSLLGSASSGIMKTAMQFDLAYILAGIFYVIGSFFGRIAKDIITPYVTIVDLNMPLMFGWRNAILIQVGLLAFSYFIVVYLERRANNEKSNHKDL